MKFRKARGVDDSPPEVEISKQDVRDVVRDVFEKHGFNPMQTPSIERLETLTSKFSGGEEILKEIYSFTDQGDRELGLRYDHTIPLARYISNNRDIKLPFKRYQMGSVFRDGPVKKGRLREFIQCDADIVGSKDKRDEAVLVKMVSSVLDRLGIEYFFEVNSRNVLDDIINAVGMNDASSVILSIDKLKKKGPDGVKEELLEKGYDEDDVDTLLDILSTEGDSYSILDDLEEYLSEATYDEIHTFLDRCEEYDLNYEFRPTLARGLQYYTGIIYEFFFAESNVSSSIGAGGRYDEMITSFTDDNQEYPSVGISIGLDVLLEEYDGGNNSVVDVYVIPIGVDVSEEVEALREDINVDVNPENRGISQGLKYADHYNIQYAMLIGEDEKDAGKVTLKDLEEGEEKMISLEESRNVILPRS